MSLQPEDILLLGVACLIVVNRAWLAFDLRRSRFGYAALQAVNLTAAVAIFVYRLRGFPPKLDLGIRVFLSFFVAWHMVEAWRARSSAR